MKRDSLICSNCHCSEFRLDETLLPRSIRLECQICGLITPLCIIDNKGVARLINGSNMLSLYDISYTQDVTMLDCFAAYDKDIDENLKQS